MNRHFPAHRLKRHRIYEVWEAAKVLNCDRQTVRRWIKDEGLDAETSKKPWLIEGGVLKAFLGARQAVRRQKLALHQLYCLGCRAPREPDAKIADYTQETASTGHLKAICPVCEAIMNKKVRRSDLETIRARIEVTVQQADPRLVSREEPRSSVTLEKEGETRAKAQ